MEISGRCRGILARSRARGFRADRNNNKRRKKRPFVRCRATSDEHVVSLSIIGRRHTVYCRVRNQDSEQWIFSAFLQFFSFVFFSFFFLSIIFYSFPARESKQVRVKCGRFDSLSFFFFISFLYFSLSMRSAQEQILRFHFSSSSSFRSFRFCSQFVFLILYLVCIVLLNTLYTRHTMMMKRARIVNAMTLQREMMKRKDIDQVNFRCILLYCLCIRVHSLWSVVCPNKTSTWIAENEWETMKKMNSRCRHGPRTQQKAIKWKEQQQKSTKKKMYKIKMLKKKYESNKAHTYLFSWSNENHGWTPKSNVHLSLNFPLSLFSFDFSVFCFFFALFFMSIQTQTQRDTHDFRRLEKRVDESKYVILCDAIDWTMNLS